MRRFSKSRTLRPERVLYGLLLAFLFISRAEGQRGIQVVYSIPPNIAGLGMYRVFNHHVGFYAEAKGVLSDPRDHADGETYVVTSSALVIPFGENMLGYLGAGRSWRGYVDARGWGQVDPWRLNVMGGVILHQLGIGSPLKYMTAQVGFDSRPFGVNLGIGLDIADLLFPSMRDSR